MNALAELHQLEQEWHATLALPPSPEKSRQLRLIEKQREGLWAKRRRELAGYTNGRGRLEALAATVLDPDAPPEEPIEKTPEQEKRSEAMRRYWRRRKAKAVS